MPDEMKIPLIEREIKCLADFKADMTRKFDNRDPAKTTYEFINKTNLAMQQQTDDLKNITKTLDTHVSDQKINDAKLQKNIDDFHTTIISKIDDFIKAAPDKYADAEQFRFWRNILILGIILSIAVGVVGILLDKYFNK